MPGQRPSWGRVVLSSPSAAILRGFCESRHAETCRAERSLAWVSARNHSSVVVALSLSVQALYGGTPAPPPPHWQLPQTPFRQLETGASLCLSSSPPTLPPIFLPLEISN